MTLEQDDFSPSLGSDNHSGVHPRMMAAIAAVNDSHAPAYGTDTVTGKCRQRIKQLFGEGVESHFVFNGTAANVLSIQSLLKSHQAVICHQLSHLNEDECAAPEKHIGCKLLTANSPDAKLTPALIEPLIARQGDQHYAQVKMISLTQPTEYGTVYSLAELAEIRELADKYNLYLHIDGARLIHAAHYLNATLKASCGGADVVSFGGTKNGLMFGELVLLVHPDSQQDFKYRRKQAMQLPSKTRFLAAQFLAFLGEDELWREIAKYEHDLAKYLGTRVLEVERFRLAQKIEANSAFVQIPKPWTKKLKEHHFFYIYDPVDWVARFMISFDTKRADLDRFIDFAKTLS